MACVRAWPCTKPLLRGAIQQRVLVSSASPCTADHWRSGVLVQSERVALLGTETRQWRAAAEAKEVTSGTHEVLVMAQNCATSARLSRLSFPPPNIAPTTPPPLHHHSNLCINEQCPCIQTHGVWRGVQSTLPWVCGSQAHD